MENDREMIDDRTDATNRTINSTTDTTVSFTWVKRVTEIGLTLMTTKARKERMSAIFNGSTIDGLTLTALINECVATAGVFVEKNDSKVSSSDAELIQTLLGKIDAEKMIRSVDPDELVEWVKDLMVSCDPASDT